MSPARPMLDKLYRCRRAASLRAVCVCVYSISLSLSFFLVLAHSRLPCLCLSLFKPTDEIKQTMSTTQPEQ